MTVLFQVIEESISVLLRAHLDVAPIKVSPESILFDEEGNESEINTGNENRTRDLENQFYGKWKRKAELVAERKLQCTSSQSFGKLFGKKIVRFEN